jgi:signal recognition particle receptor subunit beta
MWNDLALGALGAVVLVDTRRLATSFASIDFFEQRGIPFVVGVNCFDGVHDREEAEIREALDIAPNIPIVQCDVRERSSSRDVLVTLIEYLMASAGLSASTRM